MLSVQTRSGTRTSTSLNQQAVMPLHQEEQRPERIRAVQDVSMLPSIPADPVSDVHPALQSDILSSREGAARGPSPVHRVDNNTQPLAPAPDSRTVIDKDPYATPTSAGDTLQGATSQDVYAGIGKPAGGMSSAEMHHDGQAHRKRHHLGKDQYGAGVVPREVPTEEEQES